MTSPLSPPTVPLAHSPAPLPPGDADRPTRVQIVLNRTAGSLIGQPVATLGGALCRSFQRSGIAAAVTVTDGRGLAATIGLAAAAGVDAVVVGGGDGTLATAAGILAGSPTALGILPLGTMNLLAKDLGLAADPLLAVRQLAAGRLGAIDLAEVNGQVFLNNSVIGLYPFMVREREQQRGRRDIGKWPAMALAMIKALLRHHTLEIELDLVDPTGALRPRRIRTRAVAVSNNPYDDGFGRFLHRNALDQGRLGLYIARHSSRIGLLRLMIAMAFGLWQRDEELESYAVTELSVHSRHRRLLLANDGEVRRLATPLVFRIRPRGLRLLLPAALADLPPDSPALAETD